ncbi:MAG: NUDIX domain-containing protein [Halobacteriaceae archaeon]
MTEGDADVRDVPVVTCFLRNGTDVLLLRRSEAVGSYVGAWGGVAGHAVDREGAPRDPDAVAREEIREETGLESAVTPVRRGDPFPVQDSERGTRWLVHPYLFECESRAVQTDEETVEVAWMPPTEILRRETVPDLWASYRAVAPTVETVRADADHGSAYLSVRALEVLRDAAAEASEPGPEADLASLARAVRAARPGMAAVTNRVNRVMTDAGGAGAGPAAVERAATATIAAALAADDRAGENAAARLDGPAVTLSRSGTVRTALVEAAVPVLVAESRPGGEGVAVAESLRGAGLDVTLTSDAAAPGAVLEWPGAPAGSGETAAAVVVGADAVLPDGTVHNKVGTLPVALAADRADVPVYAVCAGDKVWPAGGAAVDHGEGASIYEGDAVDVHNPLFEATPADLIAGVITEEGVLDADAVAALAADHAARADWDDPGA